MAARGMVTFSAPAALPSHVALCIGNSKYATSPLVNAAHDAEDVAALCRKLGFATELLLEASLEDLLSAVEAFTARLTPGGVALFFFAGARCDGMAHGCTLCSSAALCAPRCRDVKRPP
jgi:hypothetical protein